MNRIAEIEATKTQTGTSQLDQLRRYTRIVADTSDFGILKTYAPQDATTNPTLILKAAQQPEYQDLVERVIQEQRRLGAEGPALLKRISEELLVAFGCEILKVVPGRVSTETDASLSFNTRGLIDQARHLIELYATKDIPRERVLIKIASTWEGIRAAEALERDGIHCNMTLLFSLPQAVACAQAKVKLISPFVGRILDWYKTHTGHDYEPAEDPGVQSVREIYGYYKRFGCDTEVMGASFRNKGETLELAGCDLLTISPHLLGELQASAEPVERKLSPTLARTWPNEKLELDEPKFRWLLNENAMATEKLAEGIRQFNADAVKLEKFLSHRFGLNPQAGFPA